MFPVRKALILATLAAATAGTATPALAWGRHPRVNEVNGRLFNQQQRIRAGVRDGQLTQQEAHSLRKDDREVYGEERDMRKLDGGHLTRADQRSLNQQENTVSGDIHTDRHN